MEPRHPAFIWSFRRPGSSPLWRFFAQVLIRLLILSPLPTEMQAFAVLYPVSLLWPVVSAARPAAQTPSSGPMQGAAGTLPVRVFPDENGLIHVTAPAGSLEPGGELLIINSTSGLVVTFQVDNDGALGLLVPATFPGTIDDVLLLSFTDPLGNVSTIKSGSYVNPATGETAVNSAGGVVVGPEGSGLRIPEGALDKGARFKLELFGPELFAERPALPGATFGAGVKVEAPSQPTFEKEVDIVFPKPADAPEGAVYYVYRRLAGPEGKYFFEAVDEALVEGSGAAARIVTASPPFKGYLDSFGAFATGPLGGYVLGPAASSFFMLLWTPPQQERQSLITGKVLRQLWKPADSEPEYVPIANAVVTAETAFGEALEGGLSKEKIGTFSFWHAGYTGGPITITATVKEGTRTATAYEISPAELGLERYQRVATANVTFPAITPPPPPPAVQVYVMKKGAIDTDREQLSGVAVAGTTVVLGFKSQATVTGATLDGAGTTLVNDPLKALDPSHPLAMDKLIVGEFVFDQVGSHTVTGTAQPVFGTPVTSSHTFVVIESGGGVTTLPDAAPKVITATVQPRAGEVGVPLSVLPKLSFTEPVRRIPGNVRLVEVAGGAEVAVRYLGVTPLGAVVSFDAQTAMPGPVITALTLEPVAPLKYETEYRLEVGGTIEDLDDPSKAVVPFDATFTTFGPTGVGASGEQFGSPGIVVLDDRAYLIENLFYTGTVRVFDVSNPVLPVLTGGSYGLTGRPLDLVGRKDEDGSILGQSGRMLLAATGSTLRPLPQNVYLVDVSTDQPKWAGAASLTGGGGEGFVYRIAMRGGFAYAATYKKGIQAVDLGVLRSNFLSLSVEQQAEALRDLTTEGQGWGRDAVVQTVPIQTNGQHEIVWDLKAGDYVFDDGSGPTNQRLVIATGYESPVLVVNVGSGVVLFKGGLSQDGWVLEQGGVVALGRVADREIAVVVGRGRLNGGGLTWVLVAVDLSEPSQPQALSFLDLGSEAVTDVLLRDELALVATAKQVRLVNLADPAHPRLAGVLAGVGGRLALDAGGMLFSTARSVFGGQSEEGGVHTAALEEIAVITKYAPAPVPVAASAEVFRDVALDYEVIPPNPAVTAGEVRIDVHDGGVPSNVSTLPVSIASSGGGTTTWPQGTVIDKTKRYEARLKAVKDGGQEVRSFPKELKMDVVPLAITTRDRMVRIQFALAEQGLFSERKYRVKVFLAAQGQPFADAPSFFLSNQDIEDAYPNSDVWWDDLAIGSAKTEAGWVTRKIDQMELPPGTDTSIRRQGFEIGAILAGYPRMRVVVESDSPGNVGTVLQVQEGVVSADGAWSEILAQVTDKVRAAAGDFVPLIPIPPDPGVFSPSALFSRFSGVSFRIMQALFESQTDVAMLKGLMDGFVDGWEGDKEAVAMFAEAIAHPIKTAKVIRDFVNEIVTKFSLQELKAAAATLIQSATGGSLPSLEYLFSQGAYYSGYLSGFIFEQVLVAVALGAVTGGLAILAKVAALTKAGQWVLNMSAKALKLLRTVGYWLEHLTGLGAGTRAAAREALSLLRSIGDDIEKLWAKYPKADKVIKRLAQASQVSKEVAKTAFKWLTIIDQMTDEVAARVITFVEKKGTSLTDYWMNRWISSGQLSNGPRAVKQGFEAYEKTGDAAENVHHVLVATADLNPADEPGLNYAKQFADKYGATPDGDRVPAVSNRLLPDANSTKFSDRTIGETGRAHADPQVAAMSDDAIEGTAHLIEGKSCPIPVP